MTYVIEINDAQRLALIDLLKYNPYFTRDDGPLELWVEMLEGLPEDDAKMRDNNWGWYDRDPIHGFCY